MKVNAILNTGNDKDIIEMSVRHNVHLFNKTYIVDNKSIDGSREILGKLKEEFANKIEILDVNFTSIPQHISGMSVITEAFRHSADYTFFLDADEFLIANDFNELTRIPDNSVGEVMWRCYMPNRLDHINYLSEMTEARAVEPEGCHKIVLPKNVSGEPVVGCHYLHQSGVRANAFKLNTMYLAHYPVRTIEQMQKKIAFIRNIFKGVDESQSYHLRSMQEPKTLDDLIHEAKHYAENRQ